MMILDTAWDLEIRMIVPFDSIIFYPDDYNDKYIEEPAFQKLREVLNIELNVSKIVEDLYENRSNNPTITIYYSDRSFDDFILLDTKMDPTDQLDLITIGIRCKAEFGGLVRNYAHEFYTKRCEYNICYKEGNNAVRELYKIDFSLYSMFNEDKTISSSTKRFLSFFKSGELLKQIIP
ncbi:hypothetical protein [Gorillibacterium sp. sgz5001074]|uniref:hypothetical protein n=1 Tax=Gorillibacterium sp. sgz5001074 TaxID=3446695 RepID=UPI003F666F17